MRVLMFGWEFPPYQAGGLATATVGLVKGLLRQGVGVTLVVPFPVTESPLSGLKLLGVEGGARHRCRRGPGGSGGGGGDGRRLRGRPRLAHRVLRAGAAGEHA